MAVAPEPYLSAYIEILRMTTLTVRQWGWGNHVTSEHLADLMDAVHVIPDFVQHWEKCDVDDLRNRYLMPYEQKWAGQDGLKLCEIFEEMVANRR